MEYLIPHYGSLKLVKKAVRSIRRCDGNARILIGDDTRLLQTSDFTTKVNIFKGPQRGFAANVNNLLRNAQYEWVVIINNDVELFSDWRVIIENNLEELDPKIYCLASSLYRPDGRVDSFGDNYSWYGQGYNRFHLLSPKNKMYNRVRVLGATGALMVVRRSVLLRYGGFSEILGSYCEDTAFHLLANNDGWCSYFIPDARAFHTGSATFNLDQKLQLSARNSLLVIRSLFKGKLRQHLLRRAYHYWKLKALFSRKFRLQILEGIRAGLSEIPYRAKRKIDHWPDGLYFEGFATSTWRLTKQLLGNRVIAKLGRLFTLNDIDS
ncbi:MAG: glycosyltransferase [bacterium]|nr:glycosyltransferase [bacterium]